MRLGDDEFLVVVDTLLAQVFSTVVTELGRLHLPLLARACGTRRLFLSGRGEEVESKSSDYVN